MGFLSGERESKVTRLEQELSNAAAQIRLNNATIRQMGTRITELTTKIQHNNTKSGDISMQNEQNITTSTHNEEYHEEANQIAEQGPPATSPVDMPKIGPTPGFQTSQGQYAAVFALIALICTLTGVWKTATADKIENMANVINNLALTLGPIITLIPVAVAFISSRGKIQSNALWATAHINTVPNVPNLPGNVLAAQSAIVAAPVVLGSAIESAQRIENDVTARVQQIQAEVGEIKKLLTGIGVSFHN